MSPLPLLPVTSMMAGALILMLVILSIMVTARRMTQGRIQFGDNDDSILRHRIRAHGNFIEIVPMVIIGVGLLEMAGASDILLYWFAGIFLVGRILHFLRMQIGNPYIGLFSILSQHIICLFTGGWLLNRFLFTL